MHEMGLFGLITYNAPDKLATYQAFMFCESLKSFMGMQLGKAGEGAPKCMVKISFPNDLDLARYCTSEAAKQGTEYRLEAILLHHSSVATSGHWNMVHRVSAEKFVLRNDDSPPEEIDQILALLRYQSTAAGLVYRRKSCR